MRRLFVRLFGSSTGFAEYLASNPLASNEAQ